VSYKTHDAGFNLPIIYTYLFPIGIGMCWDAAILSKLTGYAKIRKPKYADSLPHSSVHVSIRDSYVARFGGK
jgi:hypothetical protein